MCKVEGDIGCREVIHFFSLQWFEQLKVKANSHSFSKQLGEGIIVTQKFNIASLIFNKDTFHLIVLADAKYNL